MINLHVEPRKVITWEEFVSNAPEYSIALDGYVKGPPKFTRKGPYANFNHHEGVDRLSTSATCAQIYLAIKQGLFDTFKLKGESEANVFVNDCDHDVCSSYFLLKHHERISGIKSEPLINKLINLVDMLDRTGGTYPVDPHSSAMMEHAWIFEPYTEARLVGRVPEMGENEMRNVIEVVSQRILDYSLGRGQKLELKTDYDILGSGKNWKLVAEKGSHSRTKMFADGIQAFVAVRENDGKTHYSIGKKSPYIDFPIEELYAYLNVVEGLDPNSGQCWGGSDIIGGSPRETGSRLKPQELEKLINEFLEKRK